MDDGEAGWPLLGDIDGSPDLSDPPEPSLAELHRLQLELDETNRGVLALYAELDQHARKLAEADRRKDNFLALLAHELRNPLAVARLALDELDDSRAATILRRQLTHLTRIVDDLLDVSRIARGKVVLQLRVLDLGELVDETLRDRSALLEASGHELVWTRPEEPLLVEGDAVRLTQVVNNLLDNAAKYSEPGSQIRVSIDMREGHARLRVRDQGRGLSEEERRRIFEMFVQTYADPEDEGGGLGIGLTLVRELIRMQGGWVEVESDGRGEGSTFAVHMPLTEGEVERPAPRANERAGIEGRRVLLVEDEDDLRELLAAKLTGRGLTVSVARDAHEALEALEADDELEVLLTDLGLPGTDGLTLAARARELRPTLPLVALSGYGADRDRERTRAAGFAAHLVKPIDFDRLLEVIASVTTPT